MYKYLIPWITKTIVWITKTIVWFTTYLVGCDIWLISQTTVKPDTRQDNVETCLRPSSVKYVYVHLGHVLTKPRTKRSCLMVPQQPQKARIVAAPPPAISPYVIISISLDPMMADISRVLNSFTSNHIPTPNTPQPKIWNLKRSFKYGIFCV